MPPHLDRRKFIAAGTAFAASPLLHRPASAQGAWPSAKPVRIVCGYPPGGSTDVVSRAYGEFFTRHFGQTFVVENKGGASGTVGAIEVKQARPDGYTIMATIATTMIQNRATIRNLAYDPEKDFEIITIVTGSGSLVVVQPNTGVTNLKEFVDFAKKKEKVSLGTYAVGSTPHLVASELNAQYGLKIEPIHYRGEGPMWADFIAGSLDICVGSTAPTLPVLEGGRGKMIAAVGSRNKAFPDVPTLEEQGQQPRGSQIRGFVGLWAPAKTPADILEKLSQACVLGGKDDRVKKVLDQFYLEPAMSMADAKKKFDQDSPAMLAALKGLGIQAE